jgi:tetratricopeptide (TPR) repeat protein
MIAMAAGMLFVGLVALYKHHEERLEHLRVERLRQSVHQLSSTILFPLEEEMRNLPGGTPARMLAVQTGLQFLKSLADDGGNDPKLTTEIAEAYLELGDIQGNPTNANLGDDKGAYDSYEMARHLLADNRSPEGRYVYGVLLTHEGDLVYEDGQKQTAAKMYTESVRRLSELDHAENTNIKLKESLELALNDLADVQSEERHADLARSNYDKALELAQQLILTNPGDITLQRDLARCYSRHGDLAWNAGNWQIAVTAYRKSFDIYDRLLRQYPDNIKVQHSWIAGANNIGDADVKLNRLDEALDLYKRVQKIEDHAVALDPANKMALRDQQVSYSNMTHVLLQLHNLAGAEEACHHEVVIAKALWNQNKHSALTIEDLSGSEEDLAEVENKKHHYSSAVSNEKQALQLRYENLRNSGSNDNLADVIKCLEQLGNYELDLASATPSAKSVALRNVAEAVKQLHQLRSQFHPGTAEDKARADSLQALEARFWRFRHR